MYCEVNANANIVAEDGGAERTYLGYQEDEVNLQGEDSWPPEDGQLNKASIDNCYSKRWLVIICTRYVAQGVAQTSHMKLKVCNEDLRTEPIYNHIQPSNSYIPLGPTYLSGKVVGPLPAVVNEDFSVHSNDESNDQYFNIRLRRVAKIVGYRYTDADTGHTSSRTILMELTRKIKWRIDEIFIFTDKPFTVVAPEGNPPLRRWERCL
ncbi:hypothetical protein EDC04DRAFT_3003764 [Pisolithus marmoratus]|nr:hypothetical protein EDC04DRAFT_3003764 [Pisolithus marmoratus]